MSGAKHKKMVSLVEKYPPSPPCSCAICLNYCARPGWWTVAEATRAMAAGYGQRMMLEVAPEMTFGVLSPAFRGCESKFSLQQYAGGGCTFLSRGRCELFGTGNQPLECRYCHHDRPGMGPGCHSDIEKDWSTPVGRVLVARWSRLVGPRKA